jgi:glycyl-tRNA synthetase alpha subunit
MERPHEARRASYLNMIDVVKRLSRGEEMTEEWEYKQMCELREFRYYCNDFSQANLERQDKAFRTQAVQVELLLQSLLRTFNVSTYLLFCKGVLRMLATLDEDDDLIESFTKLRH